MTADEFLDLMPHVITVSKQSAEPNEWGQRVADPGTVRQYRCLVDSATSVIHTAQGDDVTVALTAYVNATPIDQFSPWPIDDDETVEFTPPPAGIPITRPLRSVDNHYDQTGALHNQVLRFT